MLRRLLWLALGALVGFLLARRRAEAKEPPPSVEDPALELRRKLEEAKAREEAPPAGDVEERRRQVHERGRSALDEMGRASSEDGGA